MNDQAKSKAQLLAELNEARQLLAQKDRDREQGKVGLSDADGQVLDLWEQIPFGVQVIDRAGKIVRVNRAWEKIWGMRWEDFPRHDFSVLTDEQVREKGVLPYFERAFAGETVFLPPVEYDAQEISGEGKRCWIKAALFPLKDGAGDVLNIVVVYEDITTNMQDNEALRKSEDLFRSLVESSPDFIYVANTEATVTFINRTFPQHTKEDVIGRNVLDFTAPVDRPAVRAAIEEVFTSKRMSQFESTATGPDGEIIHFESRYIPQIREGKVETFIGITTDITGRKRAEEEKLALERQVQHAQKLESLGVLAGGIAHDFNNLLMAILGNAGLTLDEMSPMSPSRRNLEEIENAAKRAADLSKQMLAYSGKGRFVVQPIDAAELIEEITHLLEVSISKKAVLNYNFAENVPTFDGDVTQIRQVIMNLITNASEAIGEKSGVIALSTGAMNCDRNYLNDVNETLLVGLDGPLEEGVYSYFEIADTGCGMDGEMTEKIFDPFFTTKFTGRGLGLSAVLGIVRGHHGALKIYSEVGKGTTFKVLFPANELACKDLVRGKNGVDGLTLPMAETGTVLIVDDEETVCAVGRQMFEKMGFSVLTAPDGREAMKIFRRRFGEIVCVLLDLTMPHMDGEETFREMRLVNSQVKVILCSGYNEQDATQRFAGKGLAGFIQKPFNLAGLQEKLIEVLGE